MTSVRLQWCSAHDDWVKGAHFRCLYVRRVVAKIGARGPRVDPHKSTRYRSSRHTRLSFFIMIYRSTCVETHVNSRETPFECFAECLCSAEFNLNDKQIGSWALFKGIEKTNVAPESYEKFNSRVNCHGNLFYFFLCTLKRLNYTTICQRETRSFYSVIILYSRSQHA